MRDQHAAALDARHATCPSRRSGRPDGAGVDGRRARSLTWTAPSSCSTATCASTTTPPCTTPSPLADRVVPLFVLDAAAASARLAEPGRASCSTASTTCAPRCASAAATWSSRRGDPVERDDRGSPREHGAEAVFASADVTRLRAGAESSGWRRRAPRHGSSWRTCPGRHGRAAASSSRRPAATTTGCSRPYWRAWRAAPRRSRPPVAPARRRPAGLAAGPIPSARRRSSAATPSPELARGRRDRRPARCSRPGLDRRCGATRDRHDDLAADGTSRAQPVPPLRLRLAARAGRAASASARAASRSSASSAGATSTTRSPPPSPPSPPTTTGPAATAGADDDDELEAWSERAHRLPDRRRRDAPAAPRGLDAQPGPPDHRVVPDQGPVPRLAARRRATSCDWLVDGDVANNSGNWQWVAGTGNDTRPEPGVQPAAPGRALRSRRRLRAPLRPRAGRRRRARRAPAVGRSTRRAAGGPRLPRPDRRPRRGHGPLPRGHGRDRRARSPSSSRTRTAARSPSATARRTTGRRSRCRA